MGPACPGLGSGAGEWASVRLGRRRLPLSTRQRANGQPGEISMCTCTITRTDISPLACTAENSMDLSALSKSPARFGMLARVRQHPANDAEALERATNFLDRLS